MPMMRRGPLDRYPVEWVLRQASANNASGCIEFHAPVPVTVFLDAGRIAAAVRGISSETEDAIAAARADADEGEARRKTVTVLALVLQGEGGWYYHDPLEHRGSGGWRWDTASLLTEAHAQTHGEQSLSAWCDRTVMLQVPERADVRIGADAWAVVVELAGTAQAAELRGRLGWDPARLVAALDELDRSGALPLHGARPVHPRTRLVDPGPESGSGSESGSEPDSGPVVRSAPTTASRRPLFDGGGALRAADARDVAAAVLAAEAVLADAAIAPADPVRAASLSGHQGPLTPPPVRVEPVEDRRRRRRIGGRR